MKLVLLPGAPFGFASGTVPTTDLNGLALKIYTWVIARNARSMESVDLNDKLNRVEHMFYRFPPGDSYTARLSTDDLAAVRSLDLDFILLLHPRPLSGAILQSTRYGVWSFHYGDDAKYSGGPPALREISRGNPVSSASLCRLVDGENLGVVLNQGFFPTSPYTLGSNLDQLWFGAAEWPLKICRDILNGCARCFKVDLPSTKIPVYSRPDIWQMVVALAKTSASFLWHHLRALIVREQWHIGIVRAPIHSFLNPDYSYSVDWLPDLPRVRFFADPFVIRRGSDLAILFEDFDQLLFKGGISAVLSDDGGHTFSPPMPVTGGIFDSPIHKSYPYVFEHDGQIFCVPETWEQNQIILHRCIQFPYRWEPFAVLLDGVQAIDPTLFQHEGSWWMFYTTRDRGSNVNLDLAFAPELLGPWSTHPSNPVKTDISGARPGGTPFQHNGVLYRSAQDSTHTYGGGLTMHRVLKLTPTMYQEELVSRLAPKNHGRYADGFHTLAAAGDLTVVDGKRFIFLPQVLPRMLREKFRSIVRRILPGRRLPPIERIEHSH